MRRVSPTTLSMVPCHRGVDASWGFEVRRRLRTHVTSIRHEAHKEQRNARSQQASRSSLCLSRISKGRASRFLPTRVTAKIRHSRLLRSPVRGRPVPICSTASPSDRFKALQRLRITLKWAIGEEGRNCTVRPQPVFEPIPVWVQAWRVLRRSGP